MSTIHAKKMRMSARRTGEQAEHEDEILEEPKSKKNRSDDRNTIIATLDTGTMVEAFKYLNYHQLAKNSLVSKRFWNVISTHRHSLARLFVDTIGMDSNDHYDPAVIIFDQGLTPQAYNEWVIRNQYSKQIRLQNQASGEQKAQDERKVYALYAAYKDPHHSQPYSRANSDSKSSSSDSESTSNDSESSTSGSESNNSDSDDSTSVFVANAALNQENWPLFEHFVRLLTDPFIYIRSMELFPQNDVLDLLTGAIDPDRSRLQCEYLIFNLDGNVKKFMSWIKGHMRCDEILFDVVVSNTSNHFKPLLDFFATGSHCTSAIVTDGSTAYLSKVVNNFVQKFIDLKSSDECQMVESIQGYVSKRSVDTFKRDYAKFMVEAEEITFEIKLRFEFVNNDVEKKLELIFSYCVPRASSYYLLKIENL